MKYHLVYLLHVNEKEIVCRSTLNDLNVAIDYFEEFNNVSDKVQPLYIRDNNNNVVYKKEFHKN